MTIEKRKTDWEAIEREYRAGQLSLREIGRIHGVSDTAIRKKAKADEWERDLSGAVRKAVRSKLVRAEVRSANAKEIVAEATARGVDIILRHRRDITRLNDLRDKLMGKAETLVPETDSLGKLTDAASVVESLSRTIGRLIPLERQAFNLNDGDGDSGGDRDSVLTQAQRAVLDKALDVEY